MSENYSLKGANPKATAYRREISTEPYDFVSRRINIAGCMILPASVAEKQALPSYIRENLLKSFGQAFDFNTKKIKGLITRNSTVGNGCKIYHWLT